MNDDLRFLFLSDAEIEYQQYKDIPYWLNPNILRFTDNGQYSKAVSFVQDRMGWSLEESTKYVDVFLKTRNPINEYHRPKGRKPFARKRQ